MDYLPRFQQIALLARALHKPIALFDLETTTFRGRSNFAITEVAGFIVSPNHDNGFLIQALIDPQRPIDEKVVKLTGITQAMVRGREKWGERYAPLFQRLARDALVTGFNNRTFDCPAVEEMNERYGYPLDDGFADILDVRELHLTLSKQTSKKGKLVEVAAKYGVEPAGNLHRAQADTVLTVELLDAIIETYGLPAVLTYLGRGAPVTQVSSQALASEVPASVKPTAPLYLKVASYVREKGYQGPVSIAQHLDAKVEEVGYALCQAFDEGLIGRELVALESSRQWIFNALMELEPSVVETGKLSPIYQALKKQLPSDISLDYLQLRVGLLDSGNTWATYKAA